MTLGQYDSAARVREAVQRIALETIARERPRYRYGTVISIDNVARTVEVQYPDETATFIAKCGSAIPLNTGTVVRVAGLTNDRYVDDILGPSSFDGLTSGQGDTFVVNSQAAMLALSATRGDVAVRTDTNESYILSAEPATVLGNWTLLLTPEATAAALLVLANHVAEGDPHTQYLTQAEADAIYAIESDITTAIGVHAAEADPHTVYVKEAGGSIILASGTGVLPLTLRGAVGQVADLFQVLDGGGVARFYITAGGQLVGNGSGFTDLNASNIATGTINAARLPSPLNADKWATPRTLTLAGDLSGSVVIDGSEDETLTATIAANSVALGTDTTGNFIATIGGTANQVDVAGSGSENAAVTLSLPQDIHAAATPTFGRLTLSQTTGTAPLTVTSTTVVTNLNSDLLDGQHGAYYLPAGNYTAADVLAKLLTVDGAGSLLDADKLDGQEGAYYLAASAYTAADVLAKLLTVDGTGSLLDADKLDGNDSLYFATQEGLESVLGDLMYVGLYDASTYVGTDITKPHPSWNGGSSVFRHGMYWIVSNAGVLDFIDSDLSGRFDYGTDDQIEVSNGDWIVATDPSFDPNNPDVDLALADVTFQVLPFSTETFVKSQIALHASSTQDPHAAAGYLTRTTADPVYAPLVHLHTSEIQAAITVHEAATDPHPTYLTEADANALYSLLTHDHLELYESKGLVAAHEAKSDPHPQYLTAPEGNALYSLTTHGHTDVHYTKSQVDALLSALPLEVVATDGASSTKVYVGDGTPSSPGVGDLWIETANISLQVPAANTNFTGASFTGTTAAVTWTAWPAASAVSRIRLQRRNGSDWTTLTPVTLYDDSVAPFDTGYGDTGLSENTTYYYRLWATNATGDGAYAYFNLTTGNDAPGPPTGLNCTSVTAYSMRLNWTAPSPFPDPNSAGSRYEVFLNGVSQGFASSTNTYFDFTGLTENTTYTVGVKAKDSGNLLSTLASTTQATGNAIPPPPKSAAASGVTHQQITLTWAAGDPVTSIGNPAGGIADFLRYRVYKDDVQVATTTGTSYTFTGLSASTSYKLEVRCEDTASALSTDNAAGSYVNQATSANPDTTPPADATITSFKPETSYGNMVLRGTWPADGDFNYATIQRSVDGANWTDDWSGAGTPSASFNRTLAGGPYAAGQTVYARVKVRDSTGNWRTGSSVNYTLVASGIWVTADSTNHWRNTNGGEYNARNNHRLYQGYYSNPAYNAKGLWYYGTKWHDLVYYDGRRTITGTDFMVQRNDAGSSADSDITVMLHNETTDPGDVSGVAAPTFYETPTVIATLHLPSYGSDYWIWADLPSGWPELLAAGTRRGVGVYDADGAPYLSIDSVFENDQDSGLTIVYHLG